MACSILSYGIGETLFFSNFLLSLPALSGWMPVSIRRNWCVGFAFSLLLYFVRGTDPSWPFFKGLARVIPEASVSSSHSASTVQWDLNKHLPLISLEQTVHFSPLLWYLMFLFIFIEHDTLVYGNPSSCLCAMTTISMVLIRVAPNSSFRTYLWPWPVTDGDCRQRNIFIWTFLFIVRLISPVVDIWCHGIVNALPAKPDQATFLPPWCFSELCIMEHSHIFFLPFPAARQLRRHAPYPSSSRSSPVSVTLYCSPIPRYSPRYRRWPGPISFHWSVRRYCLAVSYGFNLFAMQHIDHNIIFSFLCEKIRTSSALHHRKIIIILDSIQLQK